MQLFRNYIQPTDDFGRDFATLEPLTILFAAQLDWKTWDTDPTEIVAQTLGLPERTDIYGHSLVANAAEPELSNTHHTEGYVLSTSSHLANVLTEMAGRFEGRNPNCSLTDKDYKYKNAIRKLSS